MALDRASQLEVPVKHFAGILFQYLGKSIDGRSNAGCIDQINQWTIFRRKTNAFEPHLGETSAKIWDENVTPENTISKQPNSHKIIPFLTVTDNQIDS